MQATVERNKETGEFSCVVGGKTLLTGKIASKIKRVHDMVDAINMGAIPEIHSDGRGDKRRFTVTLGEFVFVSGMSAHGGYKALDELEEVLAPETVADPQELLGVPAVMRGEMPAVPVPDARHHQFQKLEEQDRGLRLPGPDGEQ